MKPDPKSSDDQLNQCLSAWRVNPPLPPRFQESVWRRIEQSQTRTVPTLGRVLEQVLAGLFARRAWAAAYLALTLFAGLGIGYWHVRDESSSFYASLGHRYVQSLDPYQKTAH